MTGKNKLIGGSLALVIVAQLCHGILSVVWIGLHPRKSHPFDRSRVDSSVPSATVARDKLGPVQDLYLQTVETWGTHLLLPHDCFRYALALQPAAPFHLTSWLLDIVAFLIILVTAKRSEANRHPDAPSLLDTIARDSTHYFVFIFIVQIVSVLFDHLAPVGDT